MSYFKDERRNSRFNLSEEPDLVSREEFEEIHKRISKLEISSSGQESVASSSSLEREDIADNTIFVGNLESNKSNTELHASLFHHFSLISPVNTVRVSRNNRNEPYALVHFIQPGAADKIVKHNNRIMEGRHIKIEKCRTNSTLIISNIPNNLPLAIVSKQLSQLGPLKEFSNISPSGFNSFYVISATYSSRIAAINVLNIIKQDTTWEVSIKDESNSPHIKVCADQRTIRVSKLNASLVTPTLLLSHFEKYGPIELIQTHVKDNMTTATIKYASPFSSFRAVKEENKSSGLSLLYWLR